MVKHPRSSMTKNFPIDVSFKIVVVDVSKNKPRSGSTKNYFDWHHSKNTLCWGRLKNNINRDRQKIVSVNADWKIILINVDKKTLDYVNLKIVLADIDRNQPRLRLGKNCLWLTFTEKQPLSRLTKKIYFYSMIRSSIYQRTLVNNFLINFLSSQLSMLIFWLTLINMIVSASSHLLTLRLCLVKEEERNKEKIMWILLGSHIFYNLFYIKKLIFLSSLFSSFKSNTT